MNGRYRLVTDQNGTRHVSSVILTRPEAVQQLATEAMLHTAAGWNVTTTEHGIVCSGGRVTRRVWMRSSGPMDDLW